MTDLPPPGALMICSSNEAAATHHLDAVCIFMNRVLEMEQTQRLFAGWDVYLGIAELVATLRTNARLQLRIADSDALRLLAQFDRLTDRPEMVGFALAYAGMELHAPWLWVSGYLLDAYRVRLLALVLQKPLTIVPTLVVLERQSAARGRPRTEVARHAEWCFRSVVLGEPLEHIAEVDAQGRGDDGAEARHIAKAVKQMKKTLALGGYVV